MSRTAGVTLPDGTVATEHYDDANNLLAVVPDRLDRQPAKVRARLAAKGALDDWDELARFVAILESGGQAYWNTIAPDAGLPSTAGAYSAALTFLQGVRDRAASRVLGAMNRWRLTP